MPKPIPTPTRTHPALTHRFSIPNRLFQSIYSISIFRAVINLTLVPVFSFRTLLGGLALGVRDVILGKPEVGREVQGVGMRELCEDESYGKHELATVNNVTLHYVTKGTGPLLLFLHGFPECWYMWTPLLSHFTATHTCVALDMRGYGLSDKPAGISPYHITELVTDVRELVKHLGHDKFHLVAHDWGGAIAWEYAHIHPDTLSSLTILNAPHFRTFNANMTPHQLWMSWYMFLHQIPAIPEWLYTRDGGDRFFDGAFEGVQTERVGENKVVYRAALMVPGAMRAAVTYYRAIYAARGRDLKWREVVEVPTLVVWGEKDPALDMEVNLAGLQNRFPNIEVASIPGCGHFVVDEQPEIVTALLDEHLKKNGGK
ncbi:Alpha/Beta hydrolase protein [Fimicolochytrium jonesii]|uniref:Alpha/Beta hydrolase protein n=1 Tax=Fimicolochytrium jonesii TaxID=1396493 RepID=UPI0022FDD3B2|nr:Alpha/Beta hydrolase protein [Fimicolochytrium jonesii]KAI8820193.1 Alpha/Beta hydrolase protein [Fimicolochytrium jonesii]